MIIKTITRLFRSKYIEYSMLFLLSFLCGTLFIVYMFAGVDLYVGFYSAFCIFLIGYLAWLLLFTSDGNIIYDRFVYYKLPDGNNVVHITNSLSTCIIIACCAVYVLNFNVEQFKTDVLVGLFGFILGMISIVRMPGCSKSRVRKSVSMSWDLFRFMLPFSMIPICFSMNMSTATIVLLIFSYYCSYMLIEIIYKHIIYSNNYVSTLINFPDEINPQENLKLEKFRIRRNSITKRLIYPFYGNDGYLARLRIDDLIIRTFQIKSKLKSKYLSLPDNELRDLFRLWYAKRNFDLIIEVGKLYTSMFFDKQDLTKLSYPVVLLYIRALIRCGKYNEVKEEIMASHGDRYVSFLLNIEEANMLWAKGDSYGAIELVENILNLDPTVTIAKNCLAFYLCDTAIDCKYTYDISGDEEYLFDYNDKLDTAKLLLDEIRYQGGLVDASSYYWSNVGYYMMVKELYNEAIENYSKSFDIFIDVELARSQVGLGLIDFCVKQSFEKAIYHFSRAKKLARYNHHNKYYITAHVFLEIIKTFQRNNVVPRKQFIFCSNKVFYNYQQLMKNDYNLETILEIIPKKSVIVR